MTLLSQNEFIALFPHTRFRYIHDVNKTTVQGTDVLDLSWNKKGYGIFFTVNGFPSIGKADQSCLLSLNGNYVDFDVDVSLPHEEKDNLIQETLMLGMEDGVPAPTIVNRTQKGAHLIWLYTEPLNPTQENVEKWRDVQKRLVSCFNGDRAAVDPSRVLRLPYTLHLKDPANPFEIKIVSYKPEARCTLDELDANVPKLALEDRSPTRVNWGEFVSMPIREGGRNDVATKYAGKLLHDLSPELWQTAGWESLRAWNRDAARPPLDEKELRATFESIANLQTQSRDSRGKGSNERHLAAQADYEILLQTIPKDIPKESIVKALTPLLEALASGSELAEAEIYIRNKVRTELKLSAKEVDSIVKHSKVVRTRVLGKIAEEKKQTEQGLLDAPLTEEEKLAAVAILKSPTLLYDILQTVKKLGVVGEEKNVLLHYLIFTSRKLKHPLSATVKGDSASGKSFTLLTTIKMFPKSAYVDLTDATPQSFYYTPDDYFKHRIIVIFEKHGGERADYAIRTLQSEGKLKIQVTTKNPETGQFEAQTIEKEGPTGFVTTTTASVIHSENDTRNISMFPDQSSEQTARVYESVDARYLGIRTPDENELKPWQHAQLCLEPSLINIPFVRSFRKYFPRHIIRTRRDYGHFLAILETSAFLHQMQRERIEVGGQTYIRATLADAHIAKIIVENSLSKSIYELPEKTIELIQTACAYMEELRASAPDDEATFTITMLSKQLGWDRDTVAKWMEPASKKGYVTQVEESRGSKGAKYKLEEKELPGDTFLPSARELMVDNPEEEVEGIYDPITGRAGLPDATTDAPMVVEGVLNTSSYGLTQQKEVPLESIGASVQDHIDPNGVVSEGPKEVKGRDGTVTSPVLFFDN